MFFKSSGLFSALTFCLVVCGFCRLGYSAAPKSMEAAQKEIISLIDADDYATAQAAAAKMAVDFADDKILARRLWEVANRYDRVKAFDYSKKLCERIAAKYPQDTYAAYARLQLAKLRVYELIEAGQYESAYNAVPQIMKDFAGHKQLCRRVWEIAAAYNNKDAYAYSKLVCQRIVADCPNDGYASYAAL